MLHAVVLFGCPGSGKSTIANALIKECNLPYISSGDIVRDVLQMGKVVEGGDLLSDDIIIPAIKKVIQNYIDLNQSFILDGFPRNDVQSLALGEFFVENSITTIQYFLNVPDSVARLRLLGRGRTDDKLIAIENRINIYTSMTYPTMKLFFLQPHTFTYKAIDGNQPREIIQEEVISHYKTTTLPY
jgi:adenylate kinase